MMPYFSLILPCYNVEKYVARCVQSILNQDFEDYEVILVDDGSTDGTPALCDALAAEHGRIRVIHKENGGLSSARNAGLDVSQGQYIWFIDSDDWIELGALKLLHQVCEADQPDVVKFDYYRVEENAKAVRCAPEPALYEGEGLERLRCMAFCEAGRYVLSACCHIYHNEILGKQGLRFVSERQIGSEDYLFELQLLLHAHTLRVIDVPLYCYELRNGSLTQTYKPDLAQRYVKLRNQLKSYYCEQGVLERYDALVERFFLWHLIIGTCITMEYDGVHTGRPMADVRRSTYRLLNMKETQKACMLADRQGLGVKKRILLLAARLRLEPMFYYVFAKRK
jgi:glycosyltransferase involved in cell wall biosynthesis